MSRARRSQLVSRLKVNLWIILACFYSLLSYACPIQGALIPFGGKPWPRVFRLAFFKMAKRISCPEVLRTSTLACPDSLFGFSFVLLISVDTLLWNATPLQGVLQGMSSCQCELVSDHEVDVNFFQGAQTHSFFLYFTFIYACTSHLCLCHQ